MDEIPTEADWRSEPWELDTPYAHEHFAGKSRDEAIELFERCASSYAEDVLYMPRACLPFYLSAYMSYLNSEAAAGDSDAASWFFALIDGRRKDLVAIGEPLLKKAVSVLEWLPEKQDWFEADTVIYGQFSKRSQATLKKLRKAIAKAGKKCP